MTTSIDMNAILAAIPGDDPAGADLRYSTNPNLYDDICEARRADDPLLADKSERDPKTANWGKVIELSQGALGAKSKDLQIAIWLAEALASSEGFPGFSAGLRVLAALLENFWDELYPKLEDDDYDYRAAPLEFLNDRVSLLLRQIPLTDPRSTPGHNFLKYQETREVAAKPGERDRLVSEGKLAPEDFDNAVQKTPASFYKTLAGSLAEATRELGTLEALVDDKFGLHAPSLSGLGKVLEETRRLVQRICLEQKGLKDAFGDDTPEGGLVLPEQGPAPVPGADQGYQHAAVPPAGSSLPQTSGEGVSQENLTWNEALALLQRKGIKEALDLLLAASSSQSSERGRCRYRFLVAKLCLKAGRPDLARPIVEQLNTQIAELQLERWECPFWVSEVFEALYQCLISGDDANDEASRAKELFKKICTMDVTKALASRV